MFMFMGGGANDRAHNRRGRTMIAYLHKTRDGYVLTLCARPCNGVEFQNGEKIAVIGKREANAICKARNARPYNF